MTKRWVMIGLVGLVMSASSGCAVLLLGAGLGAGYAISEDSATAELDRTFGEVWSIALHELKQQGVVNVQDREHGKIEANVQDAKIVATVEQMTEKTVKLRIAARKNLLPQPKLAQKLIVRILNKF